MRRIIPQSDSEMGNMLAKKKNSEPGVGIEPGVNQSSMMETHVIPNDNILEPALVALAPLPVEECYRAADLEIEGVVWNPVWHGGGGRHDC